jgi:uncharacterized RDD family membrane protein YckC
MSEALPDPVYQSEFYADVPLKRALAWIVDGILIAVVSVLLVPLTAFTALFYLPLLFLAVSFVYRTATLAGGSATWGMRLMAIEFRDHRGRRFDLPTAALHTLGYTVTISTVLPQLVSMALMAFGPRGQGLTDLVLGSVAINRPASA